MPDGDSGPSTSQAANNAPVQATNDPASRLPPLAQAPPLSIASDDLRRLILDYLSHSCFVDSAIAFSNEWEQAEGAASSSRSFYGSASDAGPSAAVPAGPSTLRGDGVSSATSAEDAYYGDKDDQLDGEDDEMMQSVHGAFNTVVSDSNGFSSAGENGNGDTAYQDRHRTYSGNKHLSREQVEQIRARKG